MGAPVRALPSAVTNAGAKTFRWFCWRCGRGARSPVRTEATAIRQLDRHAHHVHDNDLPAHGLGTHCDRGS
jgi:hypothetical protein